MKKVTFNSIRNAYAGWLRSSASSLRDVYGTWSAEKEQAYNYCRKLFTEYNGELFRIIGANSFSFSVGFTAMINGEECFVYITKTQGRYAICE